MRSDPLESLRLVAVQLADAPSPHAIGAVVAGAAIEALRADSVIVAVWDELRRHVRVVHEHGLSRAARRRLAAALGTLETAGHVEDTLDSTAEVAVLMPPRERPTGIVVVGRVHGGAFSGEERRFLETVTAVAALALEHHDSPPPPSHMQLADMQINLADQAVVLGNRHAHLTPSELRILLFLAAEPGRARSRREILRHVWHTDHVGDERACDAHISNLRRKIERDPSRPTRVVTIRNVGYALRRS